MQQIGVKERGGCLLEGAVFSGAYGMPRSHTFQYLSYKCPKKLCPYLCEFRYTVYQIGLQFYVVEIEIFNKASP